MHYSSVPSGYLGQGEKNKNVTQLSLTAQHRNALLWVKKKECYQLIRAPELLLSVMYHKR
jgi:hypothetical protein